LPISSVISSASSSALGHRLEGAAQDLPALARRMRRPLVLHRDRGVERGHRVVGRRVGDLHQRLAGRRVLHRERLAAAGVAPLAADEELMRRGLDDRRLAVGCDAHAATVSVPSSSEMDTSIE
jgi:hypothetical protein